MTVYGDEISFTTVTASVPTLTTSAITSIAAASASSGGNISSDGGAPITARGVCWNTSTGPTTANSKTTDGTGSGSFTSSLTGLTANTTYYVRAYVTNIAGTAYGDEINFTTNAPTLPSISTTSISGITQNTGASGGNISSDGGALVTARGVCWNTSTGPTIANSKTTDGTGTGSFTSSLTGLTINTTYYVRAYATNSVGTAYGNEISFTTNAPSLPSISTTSISGITQNASVSGGNITDDGGATVIARGVCWKTTANPTITDLKTIDGSGTGSFSSNITGLSQLTAYHVRAYATNSAGTAYGADVTFTTICAPTINTTTVSSIAITTATSGGNVTSDCGSPVTARSVCWDTFNNPTIADPKTIDGSGTGSFTSNITGLTPGTLYHVRAYATNAGGTVYGTDVSFSTLCLPSITTTALSSITATTATSGGNVTSDCGSTVVTRGVCWSTSANPTIADSRTYDGSGIGSFASNITGLTPGTTYHVRAYATNAAGTAYGADVAFTTVGLPSITTAPISSFTNGSATCGGNITSDGGAPVTTRGICWSIAPGPTTSNSKTSDGTGIGSFVSSLTDLLGNTTYYVRAYAVNSVGKVYGNEITFTTLSPSVPTLSTTSITSITTTTATSGGNIANSGGSPVTSRGVCWRTNANPTIADAKTTDGISTGLFTSSLTGLIAGTTYHVRAYATNSVGTAYGEDMTFTTISPTVTDIDGNVYDAITIGGQIWMKENLKTVRYNDGTTIPLQTDNTTWYNLTTAAYCFYNNDPTTYKDTYGALYNWYAVNTMKLCPTGWHVPANAEWTTLINFLGGVQLAGGKMKEVGTTHWNSPNTGTNESGFTALPGGDREYNGLFGWINIMGYLWSTTEFGTTSGWQIMISYSSDNANQNYDYLSFGKSVRCLRDQ